MTTTAEAGATVSLLEQVACAAPLRLEELAPMHDDHTMAAVRGICRRPAQMPHLIFFGPSGCGKQTLARALVAELFHAPPHEVQQGMWHFGPTQESWHRADAGANAAGDANVFPVWVRWSVHHTEVDLAQVPAAHVQLLVKLLVRQLGTQSLPMSTWLRRLMHPLANASDAAETIAPITAKETPAAPSYRVLILRHVDRVPVNVQHALRWSMEQYMSRLRVILLVTHLHALCAPLRSRCLVLRVPVPMQPNQLEHLIRQVQHSWRPWLSSHHRMHHQFADEGRRQWHQLHETNQTACQAGTHLRAWCLAMAVYARQMARPSGGLTTPSSPASLVKDVVRAVRGWTTDSPNGSRGFRSPARGARWCQAWKPIRQRVFAWCASGYSPHWLLWCILTALVREFHTVPPYHLWRKAVTCDRQLSHVTQSAVALEACMVEWLGVLETSV